MVGNIRHKASRPSKNTRRRGSVSSTSTLTSDGGYSALEELDDSEDEDEDGVTVAETEAIFVAAKCAQRRNVEGDHEDDEENDADADDDDDDLANLVEVDDSDISGDYKRVSELDANNDEAKPLPVKRQVRFAGVPDTDSDSDSTTETSNVAGDFFPDIFVDQNALDPGFRREIEEESDSTVSSSFWDYTSTLDPNHLPPLMDMDLTALPLEELCEPVPTISAEDTTVNELDGYECDGDTTEDDIPEPLPARKHHGRHVQSFDSDSSDSDLDNDVPVRHRRGHPRVGRYALSSKRSKPVAVIHPVSGKMVIFTPEKPRNKDILSDPLPSLDLLPPHLDNAIQSSPYDMNMAGFNALPFGDFDSQAIGAFDAFFPPLSSDAIFAEDSDDVAGELVDDDDEANLRIEDFIHFDRTGNEPGAIDDFFSDKAMGAFETDDNIAGPSTTDNDGDEVATPRAITPSSRRTSFVATSSVFADDETEATDGADNSLLPPLMAHFHRNSDSVGAFRRNQINQQLINSNKATPDSLAFSAPYTLGTLRGIKSGSLDAVATPITPPRRPKRPVATSIASDTSTQKRKATGVEDVNSHSHKRHRSISQIKDITL